MADIIFNCPHCTKSLAVDERGAGCWVKCVDCGRTIKVPDNQSDKNHMSAHSPGTSQAQKNGDICVACFNCGTPCNVGAVLCTNCGFNFRTGTFHECASTSISETIYPIHRNKRVKEEATSTFGTIIKTIGLIVGVVFVGFVFFAVLALIIGGSSRSTSEHREKPSSHIGQPSDLSVVNFAETTFMSFARGDQSVAGKIDWSRFSCAGIQCGDIYNALTSEEEKTEFGKAIVASASKELQKTLHQQGASLEQCITGWRLHSRDKRSSLVAAELQNGGVLMLSILVAGPEMRLAAIDLDYSPTSARGSRSASEHREKPPSRIEQPTDLSVVNFAPAASPTRRLIDFAYS